MHSPLLRSIKVIEKNFVTKGRKKLHKAKLYYLRKRNPSGTCLLYASNLGRIFQACF